MLKYMKNKVDKGVLKGYII